VDEQTADLARTVQALEKSNEQLVSKSYQLRALTAELTMAEHRQRHRIAQILHDGLQQHLVIAKLQLSMLASGTIPEDPLKTAGKVEKLIGEAISMSRSLSMEISPPVLHKKNLLAGFQWLAGWMESKHGLKVELQVEDQPRLPEDVKILVFESVRELLFNTVKHAHVSFARLFLGATREGGIQVRVSDKGNGFDTRELFDSKTSETGFGLFSIHERIGSIGGCLNIEASPGNGSSFTLTVPCQSWAEQSLLN
jgi:signal transduction histidine kinase